jgi:hypothetical protein
MSDTSPRDQSALLWNAKGGGARAAPRRGIWRLHRPDGRVQSCVLRDDSRADAGWDVMVLQNDEPPFSRRCPDEGHARFVAASTKKDLLRQDGSRCAADAITPYRDYRASPFTLTNPNIQLDR